MIQQKDKWYVSIARRLLKWFGDMMSSSDSTSCKRVVGTIILLTVLITNRISIFKRIDISLHIYNIEVILIIIGGILIGATVLEKLIDKWI